MNKDEVLDDTMIATIVKMDFEGVEAVFDALNFAFHPAPLMEGDELDRRMLALWNLFLVSVGWSEDEFWDEVNHRDACCKEHTCVDCGKSLDEDGEHSEVPGSLPLVDKSKLN